MQRGLQPTCLQDGCDEWTERWERRLLANRSASFSWNVECEPRVREALARDTGGNCAYCDKRYPDPPEIEHFKPKRDFPAFAYRWENLFHACGGCNRKKGTNYDDLLLRPDEDDFSFERYFDVTVDFKLVPHPNATSDDKRRAEVTIRTMQLNRSPLVKARTEKVLGKNHGFRFISGNASPQ